MDPVLTIADVAALADRLRANVLSGVHLPAAVLEVVLATLLADGHLLVEDYPGVGKTQLARTLASSFASRFARVQATVDLLPSDIVGTSIWRPDAGIFEFRPGPVFAHLVLVDELNRATPKTQSGLLEAMQERQVTVDGESRPLPSPFIVIATQNPAAGYDGTYALPLAQLDRFLARVSLGYPSAATREHPLVEVGASPRAGLLLVSAARARAAVDGRDFVVPDDIQAMARAVLRHRLQLVASAPVDGAEGVVADVLATVSAR
jgi:MoxR-like ATPase